jgi:hypothetical protein
MIPAAAHALEALAGYTGQTALIAGVEVEPAGQALLQELSNVMQNNNSKFWQDYPGISICYRSPGLYWHAPGL